MLSDVLSPPFTNIIVSEGYKSLTCSKQSIALPSESSNEITLSTQASSETIAALSSNGIKFLPFFLISHSSEFTPTTN